MATCYVRSRVDVSADSEYVLYSQCQIMPRGGIENAVLLKNCQLSVKIV